MSVTAVHTLVTGANKLPVHSRNRLTNFKDDLRVAHSTVRPTIDKICKIHQAQVSY